MQMQVRPEHTHTPLKRKEKCKRFSLLLLCNVPYVWVLTSTKKRKKKLHRSVDAKEIRHFKHRLKSWRIKNEIILATASLRSPMKRVFKLVCFYFSSVHFVAADAIKKIHIFIYLPEVSELCDRQYIFVYWYVAFAAEPERSRYGMCPCRYSLPHES